jgi:hypothetical protein
MHVRLHDLMLIRAMFVRSILRAGQRRGQRYHRESSKKGEHFPRMLAHVVFLLQGLGVRCYGYVKRAATPRREQVVSARTYASEGKVPIQPDVS